MGVYRSIDISGWPVIYDDCESIVPYLGEPLSDMLLRSIYDGVGPSIVTNPIYDDEDSENIDYVHDLRSSKWDIAEYAQNEAHARSSLEAFTADADSGTVDSHSSSEISSDISSEVNDQGGE